MGDQPDSLFGQLSVLVVLQENTISQPALPGSSPLILDESPIFYCRSLPLCAI